MNQQSKQYSPGSAAEPGSSASRSEPAPRGSRAGRGNDEAAELERSVSEGATDLSGTVKDIAATVATQARSSVEGRLETRKDRAVQGLGDVAEALRHTGEHLRSQDKTELTDYIARAADRVEAASGYFQNKDFGQIMGDVERFARREPALFLGGAFVVGLVGGRFLKSSGSQASVSQPEFGQGGPPRTEPDGANTFREV